MRLYTINHKGVASGTSVVTTIEATSAAAKVLAVIRSWLSQQGSTTSAQQAVEIARKSAAGTNVTSPNIKNMDASDTAFGGTARGMCTTEGTLTDDDYPDSFNWLNGWLYLPVPEERFVVGGSGIICQRMPAAPPSLTINAGLIVGEIS